MCQEAEDCVCQEAEDCVCQEAEDCVSSGYHFVTVGGSIQGSNTADKTVDKNTFRGATSKLLSLRKLDFIIWRVSSTQGD